MDSLWTVDLLKNSSLARGDLIDPVTSTSEGHGFVDKVVLVFFCQAL